MKRIIIVYNPRSSRYDKVRREILEEATKLNGYMVGKYEIKKTSIDENVQNLTEIIKENDLIVAVGGDATGAIASNAILRSGLDVRLAMLPYGNFNDLSRTLGVSSFEAIFDSKVKTQKYYPLEILINDRLVRYSTCYVTIGMIAESVGIYDEPKVRRKLKTSFGRRVGSYWIVAGWYFKNRHKREFLPSFKINGKKVPVGTSDYIAVNSRYMARVMRGGKDYLRKREFRSDTYKLTSFIKLCKMMTASMLKRVPGKETVGDEIIFDNPSSVTLQAEGESIHSERVTKIEIKKGKKYLKVIVL